MAKTWFRVHTDGPASILRNRKLQTLPPPLFKWLVNLWAFACRNDGCLPTLEDIAWELHVPLPAVSKIVSELTEKRFLEQVDGAWVVHDWSDHQFESDSSTERVRKFRERKRNVSETPSRAGGRSESESVFSEAENLSVLGTAKPEEHAAAIASFHGWFATYPKPVRKTAAREAWRRLVDAGEITIASVPDVIAGTDRWRTSKEWGKEDGEYIPDASTFLTGNQKHSGRLWKEHPPQILSAERKPSTAGVDPEAEWVEPEHWKNYEQN